MSTTPLTPVSAREVVHLLMLENLAKLRSEAAVVLKGGVNLRLFFGNVRYSEDMDLDGAPSHSDAIRSTIKGVFRDRALLKRLRSLGIRGLDPGEGPNKDTETTFRYKFGVELPGTIRHPTKVEVSFRRRHPADATVLETIPARFSEKYGLPPIAVSRYVREAAVRQKIDALAGRREAQARDVFDLSTLAGEDPSSDLLVFLARTLTRDRVAAASERALSITFGAYVGQVIEFLDADVREQFGTRSAWDDIRLRTAGLLEAVARHQENA